MKLTVKDLLNIPILSDFKVVAGSGGLDKPVSITEILDFEFAEGISFTRSHMFTKNSFVLTSLLFAKGNPSLMLDAARGLFSIGVSCLAYKTILFKELPQEVIDFANENNLPILEFSGDEFFEDIIFAVNTELSAGDDLLALEKDLGKVFDKELSQEEIVKIARIVNPNFKKYIQVVSVYDKTATNETILKMIKQISSAGRISKKASICKFRDVYLIFLSQDTDDPKRFKALLSDIFVAIEADESNINCGASTICSISDGFDKALRNSYWACNVAYIENAAFRSYETLGVYRLIAPSAHSNALQTYMREYLSPLGDKSEELLETACAYVLARGDIDETAEKLFCHKNTIRYRLSRLHELLDPLSNNWEFQENLSIAIRIHLLSQFL